MILGGKRDIFWVERTTHSGWEERENILGGKIDTFWVERALCSLYIHLILKATYLGKCILPRCQMGTYLPTYLSTPVPR